MAGPEERPPESSQPEQENIGVNLARATYWASGSPCEISVEERQKSVWQQPQNRSSADRFRDCQRIRRPVGEAGVSMLRIDRLRADAQSFQR